MAFTKTGNTKNGAKAIACHEVPCFFSDVFFIPS